MESKMFDATASSKILESLEQSQHNTQPFLGSGTKDVPVVVGDVNNIDSENDYIVEFLYPHNYSIQGDFESTEDGLIVTRKFSSITITPRKARKMRHAVSTLLLYFSKVSPTTGEHSIMTLSDVANVYGQLSDEIVDAMESIVSVSLGISDIDMEYITDKSLLDVVGELVVRNSGFFQRNTQ